MPSSYTQIRRRWQDVDPERDLKALWASERLEHATQVQESLRITELAIRVSGWDTVKGWARAQLERDAILHAQLVELAMRALEQPDDAFCREIGAALLARSPASWFRFWLTLFTARHSHRGERIFRAELAEISDHRLVKYRRWVRRIFRKLRFRCKTGRERAIGAVAFSMRTGYVQSGYSSEPFDAWFEASRVASTWETTKQERRVSPQRQAEIFAVAAARLGIVSVAEGLRTSTKIPRTLGYLEAVAPKMSDLEIRRSLRVFDTHLTTADHKKASERVVRVADYLAGRLSAMEVSLEEWCKILPYTESPVLVRVLETLIGAGMDGRIEEIAGALTFAPIPIADLALDARGARIAFLLSYLLHRAHPHTAAMWIDAQRAVHVVSHTSPEGELWPYGVGLEPAAQRWEATPSHPHRIGLATMVQQFPLVSRQQSPSLHPLDPALRALRWQLWQRQLLEGATSGLDVPILFLAASPPAHEREALSRILDAFPAAVLVLFESRWIHPLELDHVVHLSLPRDLEASLRLLQSAAPRIDAARASFAERKDHVDRYTRRLLLAPAPAVVHATRVPHSG
ncbi:MAG TPA: hypothetical protein ENK18_08605 [Deltaproteobacteria bacterium]|nr:hypothetical protein [Deltaproteobacteria bacterium]